MGLWHIHYTENWLEFPELTAFGVPQHPASGQQVAALQTWDLTWEQSKEGVCLDHTHDMMGW